MINSFLLHQKLLKNLAPRMVTDWSNCLIIICLVLCLFVHVCVWGCGKIRIGLSEKILMTYKANSDLERILPA